MDLDDKTLRSFRSAKVFKDNTARINSIDFHRTHDLLVTAADDDSIRLYATQSAKHQRFFMSSKYGAANISFTHDPSSVIYSSTKGNDHAWRYHDLHSNKYLCYFRGHSGRVTTLCMSPKSDTVLSAAQDKHVRLWDLRSPNCAGILRAPGLPTAAYDEQGLVFCLGTESGIIKLYDVRNYSGGPFTTFTVSEERSSAAVFHLIRFSLDGESLLAVVEGRMYLLDAFSGQTLQRVETGAVAAKTEDGGGVVPLEACFSPDGKYIISGCGDRSIRAWSATTGREVVRYEQTHPDVPACLKWSPKKMLFASACQALMFHIPDLGQLIDG